MQNLDSIRGLHLEAPNTIVERGKRKRLATEASKQVSFQFSYIYFPKPPSLPYVAKIGLFFPFLLLRMCFLPGCYIGLLYLICTSHFLFQLVPISTNQSYHTNMNPP